LTRTRNRVFEASFAAVVAAMIIAAAVAVALSRLKAHRITGALDQLGTVSHGIQFALHQQIGATATLAARIIRDDEVCRALTSALRAGAGKSDRYALRTILARYIFPLHFTGFYLIGRQRRIVASMKERDTGRPLPDVITRAVGRLDRGEAFVVTHAFPYGGRVDMWLLRAVLDPDGRKIGYFALVLGRDHRFSATTLAAGQSQATGETYLVDEHGLMLSESRFNNDLRRIGLLQRGETSTLHVRVADPGRNLLTRTPAGRANPGWPLTRAVRQVLRTHRAGRSPIAYRDYRGVPVFGAWQWDDMLRVAIITEIDEAEALDEYYFVRRNMLLLLAVLLIGGISSVTAYTRLRVRSEREANRHRNLLLESTAEAICGIDRDGRCNFVNRAFLDILGYEEHEVTGRDIHGLIHHSHPDGSPYSPDACDIYRAHRERTHVHRDDESFWRKDGREIKVEYWAHPVFEGNEAVGSVLTFLDITDKRRAEAERKKMEQQVQHTQRLESLGVLAGGIAHDFNNLLAAILGNASLAETHALKEPLKAKERISRIIQSAEKAGMLCKQMLAYSGKGQFVLKALDLSVLVEEMTHLLEVSINKSVVIKYHLGKHLPAIRVDEAQIQQVVMNLVTNANEAIGAKSGVISITTGVMRADQDYLRDCHAADGVQPGRFAYVEVSDTGCGMDRETMRRVFDPFFTTKVAGRGLGMSAVLGIVRGHHGALKVYSEPGRGTTFKFLLPVAGAARAAGTGARDSIPLQHLASGAVLVVDDEETVREMACMMLEDMGFQTIAAANGEEALRLYKRHRSNIVLVLSDLTMPHMDGRGLFTALKRVDPDCRIILSSGYNSQEAIQQFAGKGLAGFIQKPYTEKALRGEVRKVLGDGQ